MVFFNALSGTIAYARFKRVDYGSGLLLSAATIPGAIVGALTTSLIPRRPFDLMVGVLLVGISVFLVIAARRRGGRAPRPLPLRPAHGRRDGTAHAWSYDPILGVGLSIVIGFVSSLLGIGGGFIHVPVMVNLLNFPVHVAAATSHFTLTVMTVRGLHGPPASRAPWRVRPIASCRWPWAWSWARSWAPGSPSACTESGSSGRSSWRWSSSGSASSSKRCSPGPNRAIIRPGMRYGFVIDPPFELSRGGCRRGEG